MEDRMGGHLLRLFRFHWNDVFLHAPDHPVLQHDQKLKGAGDHSHKRGIRPSGRNPVQQRGPVYRVCGAGGGVRGLRYHPERPESAEPERRLRCTVLQQLYV